MAKNSRLLYGQVSQLSGHGGLTTSKRRGAGEAQPGEETRTASNLFTSEGNLAGSSAHLCLNFLFYIMDRQWRGWKLTFYVVSGSPSYSQPTLCSPHLKPLWVSMCRLSPHLLDTSVQGHWLREAPKTRPELASAQSSLGSSVWLVFSLYPMPALLPPGCEVHKGDGMLGEGWGDDAPGTVSPGEELQPQMLQMAVQWMNHSQIWATNLK